MRLYFDLRDKQHTLPDVVGSEVADLAEARRIAVETIRRMREENARAAEDWSGWSLDIVDEAGTVLVSIDLDAGVE